MSRLEMNSATVPGCSRDEKLHALANGGRKGRAPGSTKGYATRHILNIDGYGGSSYLRQNRFQNKVLPKRTEYEHLHQALQP